MRTQKYTQVEALVAKYKNVAKNKKTVIEAQKGYHEDFRVLGFEKQLIAHFYMLAAGENADADIKKYFGEYSKYYFRDVFSMEEEAYLVDNFSVLAEFLLNNAGEWSLQSLSYSEVEWDKLVAYLLRRKENVRVFLPSTYMGGELLGFKNSNIVVGEGYEYAAIRAYNSEFKVKKFEKIEEKSGPYWQDLEQESFDIFIGDVNSSLLVSDEEMAKYLKACYSLVREGGEILISISRDELLSPATSDFRKMIVEKKELAEVIQFPKRDVLLHIVKTPQKTCVMTDASTLMSEDKSFAYCASVDVDRFLRAREVMKQSVSDKQSITRCYSYSSIKKDIILPSFYFNELEGEPLNSFVESVSCLVETDECAENEKVVTVNNLSHVFSKGEIDLGKVKNIDLSRARHYWRSEGPCVIIGVSKKAVAVGYVLEKEPILVPKNLKVLKISCEDDARYLSAFLLSKEVQETVCSLVYGTKLHMNLCEHWLELVRIPKRSKEEQLEYVQSVNRKDWKAQEQLTTSATVRYKQEIRLRKHALSQNISSFDSLFRSMAALFKEQGGRFKKTDKISPVSDLTVEDTFKLLIEKLEVIRNRVDHIAEEQDWGNCECIEPQEFIEEFERTHQGTNFKFKHTWDAFEGNKFKKDMFDKKTGKVLFHAGESFNAAWFPKAALTQVLENIVANAREHGFTDPERRDYEIVFDWGTDGLNLNIYVLNNRGYEH